MKLRTFKNKKDNLFYFQLISPKLGKVFLSNPNGFESKIVRNDLLISALHSLSDERLINLKKSKNEKYFFVLNNRFGKTLIRSKKFKKEDFILIVKELKKDLPKLQKIAWAKPHSSFLNKFNNTKNKSFSNQSKNQILKKDRKPKAEKQYLKKGQYPFNDIYYDIFLSGNGKHYFSFVNKAGKTILLNGNIKGFESLEQAEKAVEEVLKFATVKKYYEKQTAKDGKFFFNLYNDKMEKIAKSFFFRQEEDLQNSINELVEDVSKTKTQENKNIAAAPIPIVQQRPEKEVNTEKEELRKKTEAEERRRAAERERLALERKRKEDQIKAEKERKAAAIAMAAKNEQATQKNSAVATTLVSPKDPYDDKDLFDGCFKWFGLLLFLGLLLFIISWYKGCLGNQNAVSDQSELVDNNNSDNSAAIDSLSTNNGESNLDNTKGGNNDDNSGNGSVGNNEGSVASNAKTKSSKDLYGNCDCSENAVVFEIPSSDAKPLKRLGTNPQFGNTHGLNSADFLEELKYAASNNNWDKKYLDYLFKAMGYKNGFADAQANQISQARISPGVKGILGFGKYSGYGYSELNLKGKDLEVFHVQAANGCHINFMKTCGNFLFICE